MIKTILGALTFAAFTFNPAIAFSGSDEDATYIVEQTITKSLFEAALEAQRSVMLGSLENNFRKKNIIVTDIARFADIFMEEFIDEFTLKMQEETLKYYKINFSAEQLEDLAIFYATPTGQFLIAKTPDLIKSGAKFGAIAGAAAGENAKRRVKRRLEAENISVTDDSSMMDRLLQMLK